MGFRLIFSLDPHKTLCKALSSNRLQVSFYDRFFEDSWEFVYDFIIQILHSMGDELLDLNEQGDILEKIKENVSKLDWVKMINSVKKESSQSKMAFML